MHTEFAEHAHELVANMSLQDLEGYDGILAVPLPNPNPQILTPHSLFSQQLFTLTRAGTCQNTASTILSSTCPQMALFPKEAY